MSKTGAIGFILVAVATLAMVIVALLLKYNQASDLRLAHTSRVFTAVEAALSQQVTSFSQRISTAAAEFSRYPNIDTFAVRLEQHFPHHQGAEFFPLNHKAMTSPSGTDLSYASLVMLREAEGSARATNIWVQGSTEQSRHVAFGHRITGPGGKVLGVIAVNLSTRRIDQTLQQLSADAGRFEVHQLSDGSKSLVIAAIGDADTVRGVPDQVGIVPNTQWQLRFWQTPVPLFIFDTATVILLSVAAVVLLGVGLGFILLFRNLKEKLRQDQIDLITAYEGCLQGNPPERLVANLMDNAGLVAHINRLNEERIAGAGKQVDSDEKSEPPEELLQALYAQEFDIGSDGGVPAGLMKELEGRAQDTPEPEQQDSSEKVLTPLLEEAGPLPDPLKNISDDALDFAFELEAKPEPDAEPEPDFPIESKDSR